MVIEIIESETDLERMKEQLRKKLEEVRQLRVDIQTEQKLEDSIGAKRMQDV